MCHPKGRSAAKDARSALTRRPARSYSAPTIPATVRHARRRSGERHERSIPRPPALPAPLADPPIAPQPTHTRLRRARNGGFCRTRERPATTPHHHTDRLQVVADRLAADPCGPFDLSQRPSEASQRQPIPVTLTNALRASSRSFPITSPSGGVFPLFRRIPSPGPRAILQAGLLCPPQPWRAFLGILLLERQHGIGPSQSA